MTNIASLNTKCPGCRNGEATALFFSMAFQPILDLSSGRPFAYEALVRGTEGEGASTVLDQVDNANRYLFDQSCRIKAIELSRRAGIVEQGARLSINFLPNAVYSPLACIQLTLRTAATHDFPLDRLIFEFTENEKMPDPGHVQSIIETYRRVGFATAIDDFGAGHAGLGLLARLTPDMLKIDMELIRGIDGDSRRRAIVEHIVRLSRDLGIIVIAEGIETRGEMDALRSAGIDLMQGFLFARPGFETLPEAVLPV